MSGAYQLLLPLRDEEYAALKADIAKRGVQVPIEVDEEGNVLDGHNRVAICEELGLPAPPSIVRVGLSEHEKREHVIKLNLARRHLDPIRWGQAFEALLAERGVSRGAGARNDQATGATVAQVATEVGTAERTAKYRLARWDDYQALTPEQKAEVDTGKAKPKALIHKAKRAAVAEAIRNEPPPLPIGPFRVIAADPPWRYASEYDPNTRRVANPYPDMSIEEITALGPQVQAMAHADSILWLWTTNAHMEFAFGICRAWGFEPKTILTWAKDRMGVGSWLRGQTEHCVMAVRGRPTVLLTNQTTLLHGPLREHSRKPDEFYALVEGLCPGAKVEMFAREKRPGWTLWGAEAPAA